MFKVIDKVKKLSSKVPFRITLRGWLLVAFLALLMFTLITTESDITATIIFISFSIIILYACSVCLIAGYHFKKTFIPAIIPDRNSEEKLFAKEKNIIVVSLPTYTILPLFNLTCQLHFLEEDIATVQFVLSGRQLLARKIAHEVIFPHRGIWHIDRISCSFRDRLGLSAFIWNITNENIKESFCVYPINQTVCHVPILSSFYRTGDLITGSKERHGEPLDLKRYHPSDGIKKISWKIFARSRILMSRLQEAASSPEGQVAVFCMAQTNDDRTAASCCCYLQHLIEAELEIAFNCEGNDITQPAASVQKAEDYLIKSVWHKTDVTNDIMNFVSSVHNTQTNTRLGTLVIFIDESRFELESSLGTLQRIQQSLEAQQIKPLFVIVGKHTLTLKDDKKYLLKNWFFTSDEPAPQKSFYPEFMQLALKNNWQVFLEDNL